MEPNNVRHLNGQDCESLMVGAPGPDPQRMQLEAHMEQCSQCRNLLNTYREQTTKLGGLRSGPGARTSEDCPDPGRWLELAAGLQPEGSAAKLVDHAASCDACGAFFRMAVEDLNTAETPEAGSNALSPEFRRMMAGELRTQQIRERQASEGQKERPSRRWWIPAFALAAAAAIALFVVRPAAIFGERPETLLAQAYQSNREWSVRIPGADYAPQAQIVRAGASQNANLAEAEATVLRGIEKDPQDVRWQQLRARADFLHRRYDSSIATLQPLAADKGAGEILADLGAVYAARAFAQGNATDYENAIEYLSRALVEDPKNSVALFNRALALEGLFLFDRAAEDWNAYLRLDPDSGWAGEAKQHLQDVTQKKTSGEKN